MNLPTSAGKSLIQALLASWYTENHQEKILIIVPTTALVDQMINDFVDYRLFAHDDCLGIRGGVNSDIKAHAKDLIRITLENDSYIDLQPNDIVSLASGNQKYAKDLTEDDEISEAWL